MSALELNPGTLCVSDNRVIEIDGPDSLTHMRARDYATGQMVIVPIQSIVAVPKTAAVASPGNIPGAEWERAKALAQDLAMHQHRTRIPHAELQRLAKRHHLGVRQLQRLRATFQRERTTSCLARGRRGRPEGLSLLSPETDALIQHVITKYYCRRERATKSYIVERTRSMARRLKVPVPSKNAVLARIKREEGFGTDLARLGSKAAKQIWEPRTGGLSADRPLDLIQIDHTPADVIVLNDDRLSERGRPWVTLAIDVASRCVLGLYVSMDAPSAVSVSLCIEHAVLPKTENNTDPGLWPMYGKPKKILVDNGKDFRSVALQRGCEQHQIDLAFRPVRTPHYGAHIERLIGTLMQLTHQLPGTTFSNVRERGDYKSEAKARLTLGEYTDWLTQQICRYYHARPHRGLENIPPQVAWERGLRNSAGELVAPPLLARPLEFRMDFLPFEFRRVQRTGISLRGSRYWHEDLTPLLKRQEDHRVHYDPRRPQAVWVLRPDGVLVTAPVIAGPALDRVPRSELIDMQTQAALDARIDAGFEHADRIVEQAELATRRARHPARGRGRRCPGRAAVATDASIVHLPAMTPSKRTRLVVETWSQGDLYD